MDPSQADQEISLDDLNRAIELADQAAKATPLDHPNLADLLMDLGKLLVIRCQRIGSIEDFDRSIEVAERMIKATPLDHTDRIDRLRSLATWSYQRFEQFRTIKDIDRAIELNEELVGAVSSNHPERNAFWNNLGVALSGRFEQTRSMKDLDRAIEVTNDLVTDSLDHPDRGDRLSNLGNHLGRRFNRTGSIEALNRAIEIIYKSIQAVSFDHPHRAGYLNNLGNWLEIRFERTASMDDLNSAIEIAEESVKTTSLNDNPYEAASHLHNLGNWLGRRFARTGSIDDLHRAIETIYQSIKALPPTYYPTRAAFLNNLGIWLGERSKRTRSIEDLDRAAEVTYQAVEITPLDHMDRAGILRNLAIWLGRRFQRTGSMKDLDCAIDIIGEAVKITPLDDFSRAGHLNRLGQWLGERAKLTGSMEDHMRSLSAYEKGWSCSNAPPSHRIRTARRAAGILASESNWEKSSVLSQGAVELLPLVSPRSLQHEDKEHVLANYNGLASTAAALALNAGEEPYDALRLLEIGRGIIAGVLLDMRSDVSDLAQSHPDLASRFIGLRNELDSPIDRATLWTSDKKASLREPEAKRRREANEDLDELIVKIRAQPNFANFLLPPTAGDLMAAANPDPIIVINLNLYRLDAFLIESHQIRVLPLSNLTLEDIQKYFQDIERAPHLLLEWLWDVAAGPCLEALGFQTAVSDDKWPHVWWITTGSMLSSLPFHAAGRHVVASNNTTPTNTVLDRVMSSYSSSIKAIIYGRRHRTEKFRNQRPENALLIAMQNTPKQSALAFARDEVTMLEHLCPSLQLNPIKPRPNREDVLTHLQTCSIFHFAGHGRLDSLDPSRSCLFLEDWETNPLTVRHLRDLKLQGNLPFLGYLSACSTGTNTADKLESEGIHLISACQLAGFRHVVGTLGEVSDEYCVEVAKIFYETIRSEGMTDRAVYRGIHRAVRALRDKQMRAGHRSRSRKTIDMDLETSGGIRDATLEDEDEDGPVNYTASDLDHLSWILYVHFGV